MRALRHALRRPDPARDRTRYPAEPFLDAGALHCPPQIETGFRGQMRLFCGDPRLHYDGKVFRSEKATGDLDRAIAFVLAALRRRLSAGTRGDCARSRSCGLYDQSGEFACDVGLPGKSGVGGDILVVEPGAFAACA